MIYKLFFWLALFCCISIFAQTGPSGNAFANSNISDSKNILKTNLTAYTFKNINLAFERIISKKSSVSAAYSFIPSGPVPFVDTFADAQQLQELKDAVLAHRAFTLEYRLYLTEVGYGKGFYIATYYRFSKLNIADAVLHLKSQGYEVPVNISAEISAHSAGLKTGYQWHLGKRENWILDFTIAGGHYGFSKGNLTAKSAVLLSTDLQSVLLKEINDLDIPLIKIDATTNDTGASAKLNGPWAGLQFGLSLGYKF